jgi:hypothetical protein
VYDYSKHSPQGEGNDNRTCNITAPSSSDKVENKLATIHENVSNRELDYVKLLPVQVGNMVKGAYIICGRILGIVTACGLDD